MRSTTVLLLSDEMYFSTRYNTMDVKMLNKMPQKQMVMWASQKVRTETFGKCSVTVNFVATLANNKAMADSIRYPKASYVLKGMNNTTMAANHIKDKVMMMFLWYQVGSRSTMTTMCMVEYELPHLDACGLVVYTSVRKPANKNSSLG